jgi:hypothetical protein
MPKKISFLNRVKTELNKTDADLQLEQVQDFQEDTLLLLEGEIMSRKTITIPQLKLELDRALRALDKAKLRYEKTATAVFKPGSTDPYTPLGYISNRKDALDVITDALSLVTSLERKIDEIEGEIITLETFKEDLI